MPDSPIPLPFCFPGILRRLSSSNPCFWRIDALDEGKPRLEAYVLDPRTRTYIQEAELGPGESELLEHPWPVAIDMEEFFLPGGK